MDMLRLALRPGLATPRSLPRLLFADELEALNATAWLAFERVLLVHNRCVSGVWGWGRGGCCGCFCCYCRLAGRRQVGAAG